MKALSILNKMIMDLDLMEFNFHMVSHTARLNWRQEHSFFYDKIKNIATGIKFDKDEITTISGQEITTSNVVQNHTSKDNPLLSISSLIVSPDGKEYHLPMMNLHLDYPLELIQLKKALNEIMGSKYYLLKTDRFFHVYGEKLMTSKEWKKFNLEFLMIDSIESPRYIGHSLERGYNLLRLNSTHQFKVVTPHLVSEKIEGILDVEIFAITKHGNQRRKGGEMYFHHLFEVKRICQNILSKIDSQLDESTVQNIYKAAILHDTIEDTQADYEDILNLTNERVADIVRCLSNDKRIPKNKRESIFLKTIATSELDVQIIKLADILSNLKGIIGSENEKWILEFCAKSKIFLENLTIELHALEEFKEAMQIINNRTTHNKR